VRVREWAYDYEKGFFSRINFQISHWHEVKGVGREGVREGRR